MFNWKKVRDNIARYEFLSDKEKDNIYNVLYMSGQERFKKFEEERKQCIRLYFKKLFEIAKGE